MIFTYFFRTFVFVPKTQTSNEIIQLNIETTNPIFTNFKLQYRQKNGRFCHIFVAPLENTKFNVLEKNSRQIL